jgi:4-hydroxy-4-methyl-2-oxoglutarate aldolase
MEVSMTTSVHMDELARLGSSTVYEADGQGAQVDADLIRVVPGSRAAGPARTVVCGQQDNLMVHAAMAGLQPGEVLVLTMPEARPQTLLGDLLATQAKVRGAAAILVDAAVRDVDELVELGLPIWARWVRPKGPAKKVVGQLDVPVVVGGATIRPGDILVLDGDGVAVVDPARGEEVLHAAQAREQREAVKRSKLEAGHLSYDLDGLRAVVEGAKA